MEPPVPLARPSAARAVIVPMAARGGAPANGSTEAGDRMATLPSHSPLLAQRWAAFLAAPTLTPAGGAAGERVLELFRAATERVPAYRAFLAEHGVDPAAVRDLDAFRRLPAV